MSKGLEALKELPATTREEAEAIDIIEQELKDKEKYEGFVQEICNYLGLDNLFPYNDLKEIEEQIKTMADNSHWIAVMQDQRKIKALETIKNIGILRPYETSGGQCWLETMSDATKITKENYDLLKEVLL